MSSGVMALASLAVTYPAIAQPVPPKAANACIQRTAEEMVVATRDISVVSAGPVSTNGVRTLFMRNNRTGQTAECRVNTIDGFVLSVTMTGGTTSPPTVQPVPPQATNACIQRTAEEMVVATRDISVVSAGSANTNGVRTLFMRNNQTGQTAECRVNTIDGTVLSVTLTGGSSTPPPSSSPPTQGNFSGRGQASGSVFGGGRQADASLTFNQNGFSLGLFVPPGTGAQVRYQGVINRLRGTSPNNPNSFVIEGRVQSFASSANGLRVTNTAGTCQIEIFDARIVSTSCNTNVRNSSTRFTGMRQF
uniref:Uncharacterized protein n=1 Tax=Oscillatoriales cyanobacterium SpSt-402 TaxID=2282168 RepID=A0A832H6G8_9CYAN